MYFWKAQKLAAELKENKVSEKEKMKYLLANTLAWMAVALLLELSPNPVTDKPLFLTHQASYIALVIVGVLVCYQANAKGDNKDFVGRFVSISWPIQMRMLVLSFLFLLFISFPLGIISAIFFPSFDAMHSLTVNVIGLLGIPFIVLQYLWISKYIKQVAGSGQ